MMKQIVIFEISHVWLYEVESGYDLRVEDTEVNDHVEDHLVEKWDLLAEYLKEDTSILPHVYTHHFSDDTNLDRLLKALQSLNPRELEGIFRLNNN